MFEVSASWWEPIVRVALVYSFLLAMVRLSGKRQLAQLAPMDLLTMLLVSETVSPALTAGDDSLVAAAVAASTLFGLTFVMARLAYASPTFERLTEGSPAVLVRNGQVQRETLERERITGQELATALRKAGHTSLEEISTAVVEPGGEITFIAAGR